MEIGANHISKIKSFLLFLKKLIFEQDTGKKLFFFWKKKCVTIAKTICLKTFLIQILDLKKKIPQGEACVQRDMWEKTKCDGGKSVIKKLQNITIWLSAYG